MKAPQGPSSKTSPKPSGAETESSATSSPDSAASRQTPQQMRAAILGQCFSTLAAATGSADHAAAAAELKAASEPSPLDLPLDGPLTPSQRAALTQALGKETVLRFAPPTPMETKH